MTVHCISLRMHYFPTGRRNHSFALDSLISAKHDAAMRTEDFVPVIWFITPASGVESTKKILHFTHKPGVLCFVSYGCCSLSRTVVGNTWTTKQPTAELNSQTILCVWCLWCVWCVCVCVCDLCVCGVVCVVCVYVMCVCVWCVLLCVLWCVCVCVCGVCLWCVVCVCVCVSA